MRALAAAIAVTIVVYGLMAVPRAQSQQGLAAPQNESHVTKKFIQEVLKEHTNRLMSLTGVVGTAIGECSGQPCIKVFVVQKTPTLLQQIPATLDGYPVAVEVSGEIRALDAP